MPYASDFLSAFQENFDTARKRDEKSWKLIQSNSRDWSQMMIYDDHPVIPIYDNALARLYTD
jgi:hypothetical protein